MPHNSVCQSRVERHINTISRSILKLKTASPSTPFHQIVDEARIAYNNTCTDNLGGRCPSDLHFFRSNANLLDVDGSFPLSGMTGDSKTAKEIARAKEAAQLAVLHHDVRRFCMRRERENPGDKDDKLKIGDLAMKKRTSFWGSVPRKLQFKLDEDAFEIISKIATNSYKCSSIIDGEIAILPGDQLVKTTLTKDQLKALLDRMRRLRESTAHRPCRPSTRYGTRGMQQQPPRILSAAPLDRREDGVLAGIFDVF